MLPGLGLPLPLPLPLGLQERAGVDRHIINMSGSTPACSGTCTGPENFEVLHRVMHLPTGTYIQTRQQIFHAFSLDNVVSFRTPVYAYGKVVSTFWSIMKRTK